MQTTVLINMKSSTTHISGTPSHVSATQSYVSATQSEKTELLDLTLLSVDSLPTPTPDFEQKAPTEIHLLDLSHLYENDHESFPLTQPTQNLNVYDDVEPVVLNSQLANHLVPDM